MDDWVAENKDLFRPPVCNKLMHDTQLNIMFVGGPNSRSDFHIEEGSEFFYQLKGTLNLGTVQQGKAKFVQIHAGEVFLLPSRIPHSPRRGENSLGLVVERRRDQTEKDCLRWYVDDTTCDTVLWERYFHCGKLERDLVPVVHEYKKSEEFTTRIPGNNVDHNPPLKQDYDTVVPDPFNIEQWIDKHREELSSGASLPLFPNHPDKEFNILIEGGPSSSIDIGFLYDTWIYQLEGEVKVIIDKEEVILKQHDSLLITSDKSYSIYREVGSIGLRVTQNPKGNKK